MQLRKMINQSKHAEIWANICFHYHWLAKYVMYPWKLKLFIEKMSQEQQRESWSNHCEFFLSSLGLAVGLGKVELLLGLFMNKINT